MKDRATSSQRELAWARSWRTQMSSLAAVLPESLPFISSRQPERALRTLVPVLAEHRQAILELTEDTEAVFRAMGVSLEVQASDGVNLVEQGRHLVKLATGDDAEHAGIADAITLVRQALQFTEECVEQTHELVVRLEHYQARIGHLLKEEQQVDRILAPLRIVQTLFRIESIALCPEMQAGFHALSCEIPKFEAEVRQTFGRHAEQLGRTRRSIEGAATQLRERATVQRETIKSEQARAAQILADLERELNRSRERNVRLNEFIGGIDTEIRGMVVNLQYQDITRQKLEHVVESLGEIRTDFESSVWRDRTKLGAVRDSCHLESLQTDAVRQELGKALSGIATGAHAIIERLAKIENDCWPRAELKAVCAATNDRVNELQTLLGNVRELLPLALASAEEAMHMIDSFCDVAANVATTARDMAGNMRLIALNAQILAAQAGDQGAGLLILAERTYAISEGIRLATERIGVEFTESGDLLTSVIAQCITLKDRVLERRREFDGRGLIVEKQIKTYREQTTQTLLNIGVLLERISEQSGQTLNAVEAKEEYCSVLTQLYVHLTAIVAACDRTPVARKVSRKTAAQFDRLERRYTMDSERVIHAATLAGTNETQSDAHPAIGRLDSFRNGKSDDIEPIAIGSIAEKDGGGVDKENQSLGDNVELF